VETQWRQETEALVHEGGIHMPYSWTVGLIGSLFFTELRDSGRLLANKCPKCDVVWIPPRQRCPECFQEIGNDHWKTVGPEGVLKHFTIVRYEHAAQPIKPPFAYGLIDLDGADRAFAHFVFSNNLSSLRPGVRVKVILNKIRNGNLLDIAYFNPVEEASEWKESQ